MFCNTFFSDIIKFHNSSLQIMAFLYARFKNGTYYGNTRGGRAGIAGSVPIRCPLFNSNSLNRIIMKIGDNVYGHNISAKFDNQQNRPTHAGVMALE